MATTTPVLDINPRGVIAVEHPMIVKNTENAVKSFGLGQPFEMVLNSGDPQACIPLYLRHNDPMCAPILSYNASTRNVLLKITVPKRTGRKRKRGSQDPYSGEATVSNGSAGLVDTVRSQERQDNPVELVRILKDNVGRYTTEAIANIEHTHRFRGTADFRPSASKAQIVPKLQEIIQSADVDKLRQLKFNLIEEVQPGEQFIPPPLYSTQAIPITAGENPDDNEPYKDKVARIANVKPPTSKFVEDRIADLRILFNKRPIWTRRALGNQFANAIDRRNANLNEAIKHVAYPIREGPFRDTLCKYGIDPRAKKQYRDYLPLNFMLGYEKKMMGESENPDAEDDCDLRSHIFDGKTLSLKASIWQVIDLEDPLLDKIRRTAPFREDFHGISGHFHNGTWAKLRAILRVKLEALVTNTKCLDEWFIPTTLAEPDKVDMTPTSKFRNGQRVMIPDIFKIAEDRNERMRQGLPYVDIGMEVPTTTLERLRKSATKAHSNAKEPSQEGPAAKKPRLEVSTTPRNIASKTISHAVGQGERANNDENEDSFAPREKHDDTPRQVGGTSQLNSSFEISGDSSDTEELDYAAVRQITKPTAAPKW